MAVGRGARHPKVLFEVEVRGVAGVPWPALRSGVQTGYRIQPGSAVSRWRVSAPTHGPILPVGTAMDGDECGRDLEKGRLRYEISFSSRARPMACVRLVTSSLSRMWLTCFLTVSTVRKSSSAIS